MSKITEVKYLRVSLKKVPSEQEVLQRFPDKWRMVDGCILSKEGNRRMSDSLRNKLALDDTYAEMEAKVNAHLKLGWVLHGGVVWNYLKKHTNLGSYSSQADELFQTMVKYEMPKSTTANLLRLLDEKSCKD